MDSLHTAPTVLVLGTGYVVLFILEHALPLGAAKERLPGPRMHGIHHSDIREEDLSIGIPAYSRAGDNGGPAG